MEKEDYIGFSQLVLAAFDYSMMVASYMREEDDSVIMRSHFEDKHTHDFD